MLKNALDTNVLTFNQKKAIVLDLQKKENAEGLTEQENIQKVQYISEMFEEWKINKLKK